MLCATVIQSKALVALLVAVFVLLLLLVVNPPLAQKSDGTGRRSPARIATWSVVFGALAFALPAGVSLCTAQ